MAIRLLTLDELTGHDVYELLYAHAWREGLSLEAETAAYWTAENRYLSDDADGRGMDALAPSLSRVCPAFNWYGPNWVTLAQWRRIEEDHLADCPEDRAFFQSVELWLAEGNRGAEGFWIMGP